MPKYSIRAPNGKVYTVDGPQGASDEAVRAEVLRQFPDAGKSAARPAPKPPAPKPTTLSGLTQAEVKARVEKRPAAARPGVMDLISHGLLAGLDTEIAGVVRAAGNVVRHPVTAVRTGGKSVANAYSEGRTDNLAGIDYYRAQHPLLAPTAEIGGALVNPIGMQAKGAMGLARVGAGYGLVSGFEDSNGTFSERAAQGVERGAIGAVAAPVIGGLIKAPGAIRNLAPSRRTVSPLVQAFDRQKVEPMAAYVGGTGSKMATGVSHMTLGGIPLSEVAEKTIVQARSARDRIASNLGTVKDTVGIGSAARTGAAKAVETTEAKATSLYDAITIKPEVDAIIGASKATIADLNKGLPSNRELSAIMADPKLKKIQDALEGVVEEVGTGLLDLNGASITRPVQKGGALSWQDLKAFRSYVGEKLNGLAFQNDTSQKSLKALYGALSRDMEATAKREGPQALATFNRANRYYRAREDRIQNVIKPIMGATGDGGPQAAFNQIQSWASNKGESIRIAQLMRSLPRDEADVVRAGLFSRLGQANPGAQNVAEDQFSPATFTTMWHNIDPRAKTILFGNSQYRKDIDDIVDIAHAMRDSNKYANTSKTSLGTNAVAHIFGLLSHPVSTLAVAGAEFGSGKLLSNPGFARWLASTARAPSAPALLAHVRKLTSVAGAQPAIANEVLALQERLAQAFTASPGRLAAEQNPERGPEPPQQGR